MGNKISVVERSRRRVKIYLQTAGNLLTYDRLRATRTESLEPTYPTLPKNLFCSMWSQGLFKRKKAYAELN